MSSSLTTCVLIRSTHIRGMHCSAHLQAGASNKRREHLAHERRLRALLRLLLRMRSVCGAYALRRLLLLLRMRSVCGAYALRRLLLRMRSVHGAYALRRLLLRACGDTRDLARSGTQRVRVKQRLCTHVRAMRVQVAKPRACMCSLTEAEYTNILVY